MSQAASNATSVPEGRRGRHGTREKVQAPTTRRGRFERLQPPAEKPLPRSAVSDWNPEKSPSPSAWTEPCPLECIDADLPDPLPIAADLHVFPDQIHQLFRLRNRHQQGVGRAVIRGDQADVALGVQAEDKGLLQGDVPDPIQFQVFRPLGQNPVGDPQAFRRQDIVRRLQLQCGPQGDKDGKDQPAEQQAQQIGSPPGDMGGGSFPNRFFLHTDSPLTGFFPLFSLYLFPAKCQGKRHTKSHRREAADPLKNPPCFRGTEVKETAILTPQTGRESPLPPRKPVDSQRPPAAPEPNLRIYDRSQSSPRGFRAAESSRGTFPFDDNATACRIAPFRLPSSAIPLPAIPEAVP